MNVPGTSRRPAREATTTPTTRVHAWCGTTTMPSGSPTQCVRRHRFGVHHYRRLRSKPGQLRAAARPGRNSAGYSGQGLCWPEYEQAGSEAGMGWPGQPVVSAYVRGKRSWWQEQPEKADGTGAQPSMPPAEGAHAASHGECDSGGVLRHDPLINGGVYPKVQVGTQDERAFPASQRIAGPVLPP